MLEVREVTKRYDTPAGPLHVLEPVSFQLGPGDSAVIMGPSGSGKSTLLYLLGALDSPTSGTITLDGINPHSLNDSGQAAFRNRHIGFVFQDHALLPQCSVLENVLVPSLVAEPGPHEAHARELLDGVGLGPRIGHRPAELSGGERQRAAIARALIRRPKLLLCDEPTGNLDHATAETVASLLLDLHRQQRTILVVVTHSESLAAKFGRRYQLDQRTLRPA